MWLMQATYHRKQYTIKGMAFWTCLQLGRYNFAIFLSGESNLISGLLKMFENIGEWRALGNWFNYTSII